MAVGIGPGSGTTLSDTGRARKEKFGPIHALMCVCVCVCSNVHSALLCVRLRLLCECVCLCVWHGGSGAWLTARRSWVRFPHGVLLALGGKSSPECTVLRWAISRAFLCGVCMFSP